ncbi:hypothetical protein HK102_000238 [Quaeritorhiza haematococci]|nr:hypothetical protein HK102_000238 [Quaeritorhiza haematococci]
MEMSTLRFFSRAAASVGPLGSSCTLQRVPSTILSSSLRSQQLGSSCLYVRQYSAVAADPNEALRTKLKADMKAAFKASDKKRLTVIKSLLSDITYAEKSGSKGDASSFAVILQRAIKKREDSVQQYRAGDRADLAVAEEQEIAIVREYLPKQMSEEDIEGVVREVVEKVGAKSSKDLGKVMKAVNASVDPGAAPKKTVADVVKRVLSSLEA